MSNKIIYQDISPGAAEESNPQMSDMQPFSTLSDIFKDDIYPPKVETLEHNYWRLDGTYQLFPDDPTGDVWGAWSASISDSDGYFAAPVELLLTFQQLHSSVGLTLEFDRHEPNWCNDLVISWYRDNTLLEQQDFVPVDWQFACVREVRNFNRIILSFRRTNVPGRYLRVTRLTFGIERVLKDDELESINLFQAASPISDELRINNLEFVLRSRAGSVPFMFQRKQSLYLYHNDRLQGVFYISKSKRGGENIYTIEADDMLGLLDTSSFKGGIYTGISVQELVGQIVGNLPFEIDTVLQSQLLYGWLPISTRREALGQVAFAIGAMVDTTGSEKVRIFRAADTVTSDIGGDRVFDGGGTVETTALVTAVEITEHAYEKSGETRELYKGELGDSLEITFSEPVYDLSITHGSILDSGANCAVISGAGDCTLSGKSYHHSTKTITVRNPDVAAGDIENVISVTSATLVSKYNSAAVAQRIYEYYQHRETVEAEAIMADERPGDMVTIDTDFEGSKTGILIGTDITLAREKTANIEILVTGGV